MQLLTIYCLEGTFPIHDQGLTMKHVDLDPTETSFSIHTTSNEISTLKLNKSHTIDKLFNYKNHNWITLNYRKKMNYKDAIK
jgi:hypothetical protein